MNELSSTAISATDVAGYTAMKWRHISCELLSPPWVQLEREGVSYSQRMRTRSPGRSSTSSASWWKSWFWKLYGFSTPRLATTSPSRTSHASIRIPASWAWRPTANVFAGAASRSSTLASMMNRVCPGGMRTRSLVGTPLITIDMSCSRNSEVRVSSTPDESPAPATPSGLL